MCDSLRFKAPARSTNDHLNWAITTTTANRRNTALTTLMQSISFIIYPVVCRPGINIDSSIGRVSNDEHGGSGTAAGVRL